MLRRSHASGSYTDDVSKHESDMDHHRNNYAKLSGKFEIDQAVAIATALNEFETEGSETTREMQR